MWNKNEICSTFLNFYAKMHNKLIHFKKLFQSKNVFWTWLMGKSRKKPGLSFFLDQIEKKLSCMHYEIIQKKTPKDLCWKKVYWLSMEVSTVNSNWDWDRYWKVQWVPLNGITDNGINQLMESNLSWLTSPKLLFHTEFYVEANLLIILYQSVFANKFSLSQSER